MSCVIDQLQTCSNKYQQPVARIVVNKYCQALLDLIQAGQYCSMLLTTINNVHNIVASCFQQPEQYFYP